MPEMPQEDINRLVAYNIVSGKYGGTPDALGRAIDEIQTKAIEAEGDLAEARKKIPAVGTVLLLGDKAKEHEAYKALGVKPDVIVEGAGGS